MTLLPPNTLDVVFALPKTEVPNAFDGDAGEVPPNIDDGLVLVLPAPPNIFWVGFGDPPPNMVAADVGGLAAVDAGVCDRPKLANDSDAFSAALVAKIFVPAVC